MPAIQNRFIIVGILVGLVPIRLNNLIPGYSIGIHRNIKTLIICREIKPESVIRIGISKHHFVIAGDTSLSVGVVEDQVAGLSVRLDKVTFTICIVSDLLFILENSQSFVPPEISYGMP